jgi:hypothetical protein
MAIILKEHITEEQYCDVCFLWANGLNTIDIHKEMFPVYGGKCLLHKAVHNWVEKFSQGCSKLQMMPNKAALLRMQQKKVQLAEELIRADRMIIINSVATTLGCSHGLAYSIIHDHLKFQNVCAWCGCSEN